MLRTTARVICARAERGLGFEQQVLRFELFSKAMAERAMTESSKKRKAFIDSPVLVVLARGDADASRLFDDDVLAKVTYVTTAVVLHELLLVGSGAPPERILGNLEVREPPQPAEVALALKSLRNRIVHSNDVLILVAATAEHCDWLITLDHELLRAAPHIGLAAITPAAFLRELGF